MDFAQIFYEESLPRENLKSGGGRALDSPSPDFVLCRGRKETDSQDSSIRALVVTLTGGDLRLVPPKAFLKAFETFK